MCFEVGRAPGPTFQLTELSVQRPIQVYLIYYQQHKRHNLPLL